jgi:hypothetical protein
MTHQLSIAGELAVSTLCGLPMDEGLYEWGDHGFDHVDSQGRTYETKASTYQGRGIELKVPVDEWDRKVADYYILVRVTADLRNAELVGWISRKRFDRIKREKQYREDTPVNYIVSGDELSDFPERMM